MGTLDSTVRQSRFGLASAFVGGGLPVLLVLLAILAGVSSDAAAHSHGGGHHFWRDAFAWASVGVGALALPMHLMGLIFGLIGVRAKDRKRSAAVAGITLNLVFGLLGVGIVWFLIFHTPWTAK